MESDTRYWNIKLQTEGQDIANKYALIDQKSKLPPDIIKSLAWLVVKAEMSKNAIYCEKISQKARICGINI